MKKITNRVRIVLVLFAVCIVATVSAEFPDVDSATPEGEAIDFLVGNGVIGGNPDGLFHGEAEVNRAEAAKILLLAGGIEVGDLKNAGRFSDVPEDAWFRPYVMQAANLDILQGYAGGTFLPGNSVNTAEFLKMLTRTFSLPENFVPEYTDVPTDAWFAPFAGVAQAYDLLPGRADQLEPARKITRNEAAVAIFRVLQNPTAPVSEPVVVAPVVTSSTATVTVANTNTNPMLIMTNAGKNREEAMSLVVETTAPVTITALQFRLGDTTFLDQIQVEDGASVAADRLRVTVPTEVSVNGSTTVQVYVDVNAAVQRGVSTQFFLERVDWVDASEGTGFTLVDLPGYELMGL